VATIWKHVLRNVFGRKKDEVTKIRLLYKEIFVNAISEVVI
jgi:hypothetical protein